PVRIISEYAWHNLFCRNLFIDDPAAAAAQSPEFTVIDAPSFKADPKRHGTNTEVVIALNFAKRLVLIGGTSYAGEMKKSIFSVLNYVLPLKNVLSMHCSANIGKSGDTALFFGLSGTGTTRRFGTVLENVVFDEVTRVLDLDDGRYTENTRAAYPISFIENAVPKGF